MSDLYFGPDGDIKLSPTKDIALTPSSWRNDVQQAYIRVMTPPGDFLLYPTLGADLERLYGMPQAAPTGELGKQIIKNALEREGLFTGKPIQIEAVPISPYTIRFDIYITSGSRAELLLSIQQDLVVQSQGS